MNNMLEKDRKLLEGLVKVWGNDIKNNINVEEAKIKYHDNVIKLDKVIEDIYRSNINFLKKELKDINREFSRLNDLIAIIEKRIAKRQCMEQEYQSLMGKKLESTLNIELENDLTTIRERQNIFKIYLDNIDSIKKLKEENKINEENLKKHELQMNEYQKNYAILEEGLLSYFNKNFTINISSQDDYDIRSKLIAIYDERISKIEEYLLTNLSLEAKKQKEEELSKIKFENFNLKCQLLLYNINQLLLEKVQEYNEIKNKREKIIDSIQERDQIIKTCGFKVYSDDYTELLNLINSQLSKIKVHEECLHAIEELKCKIKQNDDSILSLEESNNSKNVVNVINNYNQYIPENNFDTSPANKENDLKELVVNLVDEEIPEFKEIDDKMKETPEKVSSYDEDILKEEQNIDQILRELDVKVKNITSEEETKKEKNNIKEEKTSTVKNEEILDIDEVIKELEKQYPSSLPKEDENKPTISKEPLLKKNTLSANQLSDNVILQDNDFDVMSIFGNNSENIDFNILNKNITNEDIDNEFGQKESRNQLEKDKKALSTNKFPQALEKVENIFNNDDDFNGPFNFGDDIEKNPLNKLTIEDTNNLDFLDGSALDNIINNNSN